MTKKISQNAVEIMFVVIAGLASVSCLARADFNLPLFLFLWWTYFDVPESRRKRQQCFMLIFVCLSCAQDISYIIYWSFQWFSQEWLIISPNTKAVHVAVVVCSTLELVLKFNVIGILLVPGFVEPRIVERVVDWHDERVIDWHDERVVDWHDERVIDWHDERVVDWH
eukprot:Selendium_serpulae@DN4012_c0_g1_i2.p1